MAQPSNAVNVVIHDANGKITNFISSIVLPFVIFIANRHSGQKRRKYEKIERQKRPKYENNLKKLK